MAFSALRQARFAALAMIGALAVGLGQPASAQDRYALVNSAVIDLNNRAVAADNVADYTTAITLWRQAVAAVAQHRGEDSLGMARVLTRYGATLYRANRLAEAIEVEQRAIEILTARLGAQALDTLETRISHGVTLMAAGDYLKARAIYNEVGPPYLQAVGTRDPRAVDFVIHTAALYGELGNFDTGFPIAQRAVELAESVHGAESEPAMRARAIRGKVYMKGERYAQAADEYAAAVTFLEPRAGLANPITMEMAASAAYALMHVPGQETQALAYADKARTGYRQIVAAMGSGIAGRIDEEMARRDFVGIEVIRTDALWFQPRSSANLEDVFDQVQRSLIGTTSQAVAEAAARRAAERHPNLASLFSQREAAEQQYRHYEAQLQGALRTDPGRIGGLQASLQTTQSQLDAIDDLIARLAPDLHALIDNAELSLAQAQAMLRPDEAVLMTMPGLFGYHLVLLTSDGISWERTSLSRVEINELSRRLAWDIGMEVEASGVELSRWEAEGDGAFPYDFETATRLYQELVAPFEAQLEGKSHLFTLIGGPPTRLPFGVLTRSVPDGPFGAPDTLRSADWLADHFAMAKVPSLRTIAFLREGQRAQDEGGAPRQAFIGVGNPSLAGSATSRGTAVSGLRAGRAPTRSFSIGRSLLGSGSMANPDALRRLASLPGTQVELMAMWQEFGEPENALWLGDMATETNLRQAELSADLIVFATHGVMAGELLGLGEPGLILTPPSVASRTDDGYLSMSEIAARQIDAEWVILSACNTASPDGSGVGISGLSGLARAFLFAGARSLLVSHWPVRDDIAPELTVGAVRHYTSHPGISRAQALQHAMRTVRMDPRADSDNDTWAHPSAWAPFSYVGAR